MKLNDMLIEMNQRKLADIDYRLKRLEENKTKLLDERVTVEKAIVDLRHAK